MFGIRPYHSLSFCPVSVNPDTGNTKWGSITVLVIGLDNVNALSVFPGNTEGGSITVPLTSCLTGLDKSILQIKTNIVNCHADSKPV
jgi:hypothetical protein